MKVCIAINPKTGRKGLKILDKLKKLLDGKKIEYFEFGDSFETPDILIVLGGDGTVLYHALYAIQQQIPILAINVGTVGYLASFEDNEIESAINALVSGNYSVTEKSTLLATTTDGETFIALNDVVVERGRFTDDLSVVAKLGLSIDDNAVYDMSGDGLIVSTPTGSTAYSLSSGGVILTPDLKSFIVTPICSHSLNSRPIVYRDDKDVEIKVLLPSCRCVLSIDGKCVKTLDKGDTVRITKNRFSLKIIDNGENFYKKLIKKIR